MWPDPLRSTKSQVRFSNGLMASVNWVHLEFLLSRFHLIAKGVQHILQLYAMNTIICTAKYIYIYIHIYIYIYISNSSTQFQIFPNQTLSFAVSSRGVSLLIVCVVGFLAIVTYATVALPSWSSDRCPNLPGSALKPTQDMRRMEKDGKCDTQVSYSYLMRVLCVSYAYYKSHMGADVKCAFKRFSRFPMNLHESSCIVNG